MLLVFAVPMTGFGLFLSCQGAPWWIIGVLLAGGLTMLMFAIASQAFTAVYLFDGGFVQIGADRRIKAAARWTDIVRFSHTDTEFRTLGPSGHRLDYTIEIRAGRPATFDTDRMPDASAAYAEIFRRHRTARH